jgi:hypothetical protein
MSPWRRPCAWRMCQSRSSPIFKCSRSSPAAMELQVNAEAASTGEQPALAGRRHSRDRCRGCGRLLRRRRGRPPSRARRRALWHSCGRTSLARAGRRSSGSRRARPAAGAGRVPANLRGRNVTPNPPESAQPPAAARHRQTMVRSRRGTRASVRRPRLGPRPVARRAHDSVGRRSLAARIRRACGRSVKVHPHPWRRGCIARAGVRQLSL